MQRAHENCHQQIILHYIGKKITTKFAIIFRILSSIWFIFVWDTDKLDLKKIFKYYKNTKTFYCITIEWNQMSIVKFSYRPGAPDTKKWAIFLHAGIKTGDICIIILVSNKILQFKTFLYSLPSTIWAIFRMKLTNFHKTDCLPTYEYRGTEMNCIDSLWL